MQKPLKYILLLLLLSLLVPSYGNIPPSERASTKVAESVDNVCNNFSKIYFTDCDKTTVKGVPPLARICNPCYNRNV